MPSKINLVEEEYNLQGSAAASLSAWLSQYWTMLCREDTIETSESYSTWMCHRSSYCDERSSLANRRSIARNREITICIVSRSHHQKKTLPVTLPNAYLKRHAGLEQMAQ
ncbi:MAG: hypothetical protein HON77_21065 [Gammaproteobacteria bacterium]|nr:hypothetical protein [Gammaproteobacteria bacterium]MDG1232431.1 hypothetical protein [Pseudomonadales bacterium]